jgi:peptidoglycan/LPS O-acetylase OafA/YrhL
VWYHVTWGDPSFLPHSWLQRTGTYGGVVGIDAFFVISGFIIPHALHRARYRLRNFPRFVAKRMLRLDPPYLASIVGILLLTLAAPLLPQLRIHGLHRVTTTQLLAHLGYANAVLRYRWLNGVYWTLAIEFQYYLLIAVLFPFVVGLPPRSRWLLVVALVAGAWLPRGFLLKTPFNDNLILSYLGLFAAGILTFQFRAGLLSRSAYLALLAGACVGVLMRLSAASAMTALCTALVIAFVPLTLRGLTWLGECSYSLYLIHEPVRWLAFAVAVAYLPATPLVRGIAACLTAVAAVVAARGFYHLIERPSQRWSSRVRYGARRQATATEGMVGTNATFGRPPT